jgi:hypothetical protein
MKSLITLLANALVRFLSAVFRSSMALFRFQVARFRSDGGEGGRGRWGRAETGDLRPEGKGEGEGLRLET